MLRLAVIQVYIKISHRKCPNPHEVFKSTWRERFGHNSSSSIVVFSLFLYYFIHCRYTLKAVLCVAFNSKYNVFQLIHSPDKTQKSAFHLQSQEKLGWKNHCFQKFILPILYNIMGACVADARYTEALSVSCAFRHAHFFIAITPASLKFDMMKLFRFSKPLLNASWVDRASVFRDF